MKPTKILDHLGLILFILKDLDTYGFAYSISFLAHSKFYEHLRCISLHPVLAAHGIPNHLK
jgi:hypothetical protein